MRSVVLFALLLATPALAATWRDVARPDDLAALDRTPSAWRDGLAQARKTFPRGLAALGSAVDPEAGLSQPQAPPGLYRCRTIELGAATAETDALVVQDWMHCRIEAGAEGNLSFAKLGSAPRPAGRLYTDDPQRLVFVGSATAGEGREQVGLFERIGLNHWRLVLPRPRTGAVLQVVEIRR